MTAVSPHILHVTQPVDAGVAAVVATLAADQIARGWRVTVACPAGPLAARLQADGVPVEHWEAGRSPDHRVPGEMRRLRSVLERVAPDVVHLHSAKAGLAGRAVVRGALPTVFQPHGWSFEAVGGAQAAAARCWERFAARWTTRLICVSEDELGIGRAAGVDAPAVVVPNGVDVEHFRPLDRASARSGLGLPDGPLAVCVGRVAWQKGQDLLLRAWPAVLAAVPDARLLLVGDGPAREQWSREYPAARHPSVRWVGAVMDAAAHYAAADVVVVPSRWEGMALVPLEAMAGSRPVVAFDVTGMRESLGDGTGARAAAGDVRALAGEVARRLADPSRADAEGRTGRVRVVEHFDIRRTRDAVAGVLSELAVPGPDAARTRTGPRPGTRPEAHGARG